MPSNSNKKDTKRGGFYWKETVPYVSVTEILKIKDKPALRYYFMDQMYLTMVKTPTLTRDEAYAEAFRHSEKAKVRGTTIHSILEAWKNVAELESVAEEFKEYAEALYRWMKEYKVKIIEREKTFFSEKYKYANTVDLIAEINNVSRVVDLKTGKLIYGEAHIQTSANLYSVQESGINIDKTGILLLTENPKTKKVTFTFSEGEDRFKSFLSLKQVWEEENYEMLRKIGYYESQKKV